MKLKAKTPSTLREGQISLKHDVMAGWGALTYLPLHAFTTIL